MKWMKNLKIGTRLLLGFSVMILFLAGIGASGIQSVTHIKGEFKEVFNVRLPSIDLILEVDRDFQQLLVAERSMLIADVASDAFKAFRGAYEENLKQSDERWEKFKALATTPEEKALIPTYEKAREEWKSISRKVVDVRAAATGQSQQEAIELSMGKANAKFEEMRDYLDKLTEINLHLAQENHRATESASQSTVLLLLTIIAAGIFAGAILAWIISRGVTHPLKRAIKDLTAASKQVAAGSDQVSQSSQKLAEGASEQAASIEETSSSLEEMSSMTKQNAQNAKEAQAMMEETSRVVEKVNRHMGDMTDAITEITRSSEETGKIIKTIDEIAFQTNLLALNAAVEAARAGEAGAGFAVVADEVRNLALRAAEAAKNTAVLIEGTIKAVQNGSELTQSTRNAFTENMEIARKVEALVAEIAGASSEQAQGIEQVNIAVAEMDKVVQEVAATAEESASAAEEMNAQAFQMEHIVGDMIALVGAGEKGDVKDMAIVASFDARLD